MSYDTIEPTQEWINKHVGRIEKPHRDQKVDRVSFRKLSPFELLMRSEDIDTEQWHAAQRLTRCWLGSQGVNVSSGDWNGVSGDFEFSRTRYAREFAEA
ncbi:MAG: hypothetical protein ACOYJ6_18620, partial [Caulobacterales bacterium]